MDPFETKNRIESALSAPGAARAAETLFRQGQGHVFEGFFALSSAQRRKLEAQLDELDRGGFAQAFKALPPRAPLEVKDVEPLREVSPETAGHEYAQARRAGEEALSRGRVAAFTAAGGHGTRLGFDGPKGAFPIGPVTDRSLFQIFAESLLAAERRYGAPLPWIIMTCRDNHEETVAFFQERNFFGLNAHTVRFMVQRSLPVFDDAEKILFSGPGSLAMAPDGHGGFYRTVAGAGEELRDLGVDVIFYFQVDNPLLSVPDPVFVGFHLLRGSLFSTKVVEKAGPAERMGVLARMGGTVVVVEYSELDEAQAMLRDPDGRLLFWAGNVANHVIDLAFAEQVARETPPPLHRARRTAEIFQGTSSGQREVVKLESFIFDALPLDPNPVVFRVSREEEFGPVKAAQGVDTPQRSRILLREKYARQLARAGVLVKPGRPVEISPLTALDTLPNLPPDGPVVL